MIEIFSRLEIHLNGHVRIFTMRMGHVYSFISTNVAITEFAFEGLQLAPSDFIEFDVRSFFDPKPVLLLDGHIRSTSRR